MADYYEISMDRPRDGGEIPSKERDEYERKYEKRIVPVTDDGAVSEEIPMSPEDLERVLQEEHARERRVNEDAGNN